MITLAAMGNTLTPQTLQQPFGMTGSEQFVPILMSSPSLSAAALVAHNETRESWVEIAPTLSSTTFDLAQQFISACVRKGAFYCDPGCHVDLIGDDQVMFDWNNGQVPIFTVLIGPDPPRIVFVGKFKKGKIKGETTNPELLDAHLDTLMKEIGNPLWTSTSSPDLLIHVVIEDLGLVAPLSIPHRRAVGFPSSPLTMHLNMTS